MHQPTAFILPFPLASAQERRRRDAERLFGTLTLAARVLRALQVKQLGLSHAAPERSWPATQPKRPQLASDSNALADLSRITSATQTVCANGS